MNFLWKNSMVRWLILAIILILFLIPGKTDQILIQREVKPVYHFSMDIYQNNINNFVHLLQTEHGLGLSKYHVPVSTEIKHYFSRSLWIVFPAFFLSILLGIAKGIFDYYFSDKKWNVIGNGSTWLGQSLPDFFFVISIQYVLLLLIRIGFPKLDLFGYDHWYNIFFPIVFLSMYPLFYIARITSSALATEENKDYVRTARSKGTSTRNILLQHMLKNAMLTILSHFFTVMVLLIGSLPIVEFLTFYRGAARRLIEAFGITPVMVQPMSVEIETTMVIGIIVMFLLFLFVALWVSNIIKAYVVPSSQIKMTDVFSSLLLFLIVGVILTLIILLPRDLDFIPVQMVSSVLMKVIL
ncbi:ABC transporter permease subunit [Neobacillus sp. D3-1R]|uniref:ABC transporter permease subunit n=1 Tax=Neobacillus sp. D3-1R TaxID=3445778 RepID=UPI003F9FE963